MNPYAVLDVDQDASTEQIHAAYRKKAAAAHPDREDPVGDFEEINRARKLLEDPTARHVYDETGIVLGADKLAESAIMLIVEIAAAVLSESPFCDLPQVVRISIVQLEAESSKSLAVIEQSMSNIEERWIGADNLKRAILMNLRARMAAIKLKNATYDRAREILKGVTYKKVTTLHDLLTDSIIEVFNRRTGAGI